MKKTIFFNILFLCFFSTVCFSQEYVNLPQKQKKLVNKLIPKYIEFVINNSGPFITATEAPDSWKRIIKKLQDHGFDKNLYILLNNETALEYFIGCFFDLWETTQDRGFDNFYHTDSWLGMASILKSGWKPEFELPKETLLQARYRRFFNGPWSGYMKFFSRNDNRYYAYEQRIVEEADLLSPGFGQQVKLLVESSEKLKNSAIQNVVIKRWRRFNEDSLVPFGIYAHLRVLVRKRDSHAFYAPTIYRVEKTWHSKVYHPDKDSLDITIIGVRKVDILNIGGAMGHCVQGETVLMLDLEQMEERSEKWTDFLRDPYAHFELLSGSDAYSRQLDNAVRVYFRGCDYDKLMEIHQYNTRAHELTHKAMEVQNIICPYGDHFNLKRDTWNALLFNSKVTIGNEIGAYLGEMIASEKPGFTVLHLMPHLLSGRASNEYFAARYILNSLAGNEQDDWLSFRNASGVIEMVIGLLEDKQIQWKARKLYNSKFPNLELVSP